MEPVRSSTGSAPAARRSTASTHPRPGPARSPPAQQNTSNAPAGSDPAVAAPRHWRSPTARPACDTSHHFGRIGDELTTLQRRPEHLHVLADHVPEEPGHQHPHSNGVATTARTRGSLFDTRPIALTCGLHSRVDGVASQERCKSGLTWAPLTCVHILCDGGGIRWCQGGFCSACRVWLRQLGRWVVQRSAQVGQQPQSGRGHGEPAPSGRGAIEQALSS